VGIMYGILSALITMALFYPITFYLAKMTQNFFGGVNVYGYYLQHFVEILLILLGAGIIIGAISSYLAVRRYLRL
jgi:cell division protein FtsX